MDQTPSHKKKELTVAVIPKEDELPPIFKISKRGTDQEQTHIFLAKNSGHAIYLIPGKVIEIYYVPESRLSKLKYLKAHRDSYSASRSEEAARDIQDVSKEEHNKMVIGLQEYLFQNEFSDRL